MSRQLSTVFGCALLVFAFSCNGAAVETDTGETFSQTRIGDLTMFQSVPAPGQDNYHLKGVNLKGTKCADGEVRRVCTADHIDYTYALINEDTAHDFENSFLAGKGMVNGWLEQRFEKDLGEYTVLYVVDAWLDPTPNLLSGELLEVSPVDLQCVAAPCPVWAGDLVNVGETELMHFVELETSGASEDAIELGYAQLDKNSLLISGVFEEVPRDDGPEGVAALPGSRTLMAKTFFLLLRDEVK